MVLIGMYLGNFFNSTLEVGIKSINWNTTLLLLGISIVISCIFIKNEMISINEDSNYRFNFIEKNLIGNKIDINVAQLIHNCSLGLGTLLILFTNWMNIFIIALVYFLWTSPLVCSPDYLKNMCYNALIAFLLIFSGWLYASNSFITIIQCLLLSLPYILLFLSTITLINFPQSKVNATILIAFITLGFIIAYYNNDPLGTTSLSVSFPFYLFLVLRGMERDLIRAIRYPLFLLIFFIFTIYPLLMIPMVIIYYLSKYYYWHRFDIHFPAVAINDDYN